jgi:hypothetical protein
VGKNLPRMKITEGERAVNSGRKKNLQPRAAVGDRYVRFFYFFFSFKLPYLQKQKVDILILSDPGLKDIIRDRTKKMRLTTIIVQGYDLVNTSESDEFAPDIYIRSFGSEREMIDQNKLVLASIICSVI